MAWFTQTDLILDYEAIVAMFLGRFTTTWGMELTRCRHRSDKPVTRRRVLAIAAWTVIGLALVVVMVIGAHRSAPPGSLDARVRSIAEGLRCPTCEGQTVADSTVPAAEAIKEYIAAGLGAGQSRAEIRSYLVSRYGTRILESPPTQGVTGLVWVLPVVVASTAAVVLAVWLRRARPIPRPLSGEDRALVARALRSGPSPSEIEATPGPPSPTDQDVAAAPRSIPSGPGSRGKRRRRVIEPDAQTSSSADP